MTSERAKDTRSERKHRSITEAATQIFLTQGYTRTSMDDIARRAQVSKQTVYQHFNSKEQLLTHVVTTIIATAGERADAPIAGLAESVDLDADLRFYAREQLTAVIQPMPMQLRRLVIAEAHTFPELGRLFHELGPKSAVDQLAKVLIRLHERRVLNIKNPRLAATDLNWLIMAEPLNNAMLLGSDTPPTKRQINTWADHATTTFLAAYRTRTKPGDNPN